METHTRSLPTQPFTAVTMYTKKQTDVEHSSYLYLKWPNVLWAFIFFLHFGDRTLLMRSHQIWFIEICREMMLKIVIAPDKSDYLYKLWSRAFVIYGCLFVHWMNCAAHMFNLVDDFDMIVINNSDGHRRIVECTWIPFMFIYDYCDGQVVFALLLFRFLQIWCISNFLGGYFSNQKMKTHYVHN